MNVNVVDDEVAPVSGSVSGSIYSNGGGWFNYAAVVTNPVT